jgi:hypothetical protein
VLVLLRGNDVLAKLGRFPNGNVTALETPKIFLGNSIKVDVVHAGGNPCRFGAPVSKQHGAFKLDDLNPARRNNARTQPSDSLDQASSTNRT